MLEKSTKIQIFKSYLLCKDGGYGDVMKEEIYSYFFDLQQGSLNNSLVRLSTKEEIEAKIDHLVSNMIMHEHEEGLHNIIEEYL